MELCPGEVYLQSCACSYGGTLEIAVLFPITVCTSIRLSSAADIKAAISTAASASALPSGEPMQLPVVSSPSNSVRFAVSDVVWDWRYLMHRTFLLALAAAIPFANASAQNSGSLQLNVHRALHADSVRGVSASVLDGVVTLTGSVDVYSAKLQAEVAVSGVDGIRSIQDQIRVAGRDVPDAVLQARLDSRIAYRIYERVHELPVRSQAVSVEVHDGVVRLRGKNVGPLCASLAFDTVANTPGVKGIVNEVTVKQFSTANLPQPWLGTGLSTAP